LDRGRAKIKCRREKATARDRKQGKEDIGIAKIERKR
jgi:hypothetical protein